MTHAKLKSAFLHWSALALVVFAVSGCSVVMATRQPSKKNLEVLKPGGDRDRVIAELGVPVSSEKIEGGKKEIYTFIQGYSSGVKASRAIFHGVADVFSFGIWEAVGTPIEGAFDGKKISVRVIYDQDDKIKETTTLSVSDP
jgi:hypothetical protein